MISSSLSQRIDRHRLGFASVVAILAAGTFCNSTQAALVANAIPGVVGYAFNQGDSGDPNGDGGVNNVLNGDGLSVGSLGDSSTWLHNSTWQDGWQGNGSFVLDSAGTGSASTVGAWFVADLGAATTTLDKLYIWNVREVSNRGAKSIDIFYSNAPTVMPTTNGAYNFASGGWTLLQSNRTVPQATAGGTPADDVVNLSSIASARYIGFQFNSNYNSNFRVGFAELQFTTVPESSTVTLVAAMTLGLVSRRRRS